jgi:hypothetical protein
MCNDTFRDSKTVNRRPSLLITILTNQFAVTKVDDAVAASDRFNHLHLTQCQQFCLGIALEPTGVLWS